MANIKHCILAPEPVSRISATHTGPQDTTFDICLGGNLELNGNAQALDAGDLVHLTIPEIGVDVELIVGQDPLTTGFQNDIGTTSWTLLQPHFHKHLYRFLLCKLLSHKHYLDPMSHLCRYRNHLDKLLPHIQC